MVIEVMLTRYVVMYLYVNLGRGTLVYTCRLILFCNLFMGSGSPTECMVEK